MIEGRLVAGYALAMKNWILSVTLGTALTGCTQVQGLFDRNASRAPAEAAERRAPGGMADEFGDPAQTASVPGPAARTAEGFDTTTESQRAEAVTAAQTTGAAVDLGVTIASLGAPTQPGFWLKTPLADQAGKGRVDYPEQGTSVVVDLLPLDASPGAGSQISLAAMRLLGADLTGLPEVRVFRLPD